MSLIGTSGRRGSGKDTVAAIIQELEADKWTIKKFADPLKIIAALMTGLSYKDMCTQEGKRIFLPEWAMTVGEFQQRLGTDAIRKNLHKEAWVLTTFASYKPGDNWLITDVRFPNELHAIKAKGGFVIRIEGDPLRQQGDGTRDDSHPSETALDGYPGFDAVIFNSGTMDELREKVKEVLRVLTNRIT